MRKTAIFYPGFFKSGSNVCIRDTAEV